MSIRSMIVFFSSLERISAPDWEKIVHIGAGSEHFALVTNREWSDNDLGFL
ncbi:hypothetical protein ZOSMA_499G00020 [Zostera marina]|uniref:Uncharacterized protein n=1 Tax=Zostera marina TaxID=29655 RepID=A0A0K9NZ00_ZOSMR|nr:hypothetical protein ZOSMA_499G00020 [Zostera marina]